MVAWCDGGGLFVEPFHRAFRADSRAGNSRLKTCGTLRQPLAPRSDDLRRTASPSVETWTQILYPAEHARHRSPVTTARTGGDEPPSLPGSGHVVRNAAGALRRRVLLPRCGVSLGFATGSARASANSSSANREHWATGSFSSWWSTKTNGYSWGSLPVKLTTLCPHPNGKRALLIRRCFQGWTSSMSDHLPPLRRTFRACVSPGRRSSSLGILRRWQTYAVAAADARASPSTSTLISATAANPPTWRRGFRSCCS